MSVVQCIRILIVSEVETNTQKSRRLRLGLCIIRFRYVSTGAYYKNILQSLSETTLHLITTAYNKFVIKHTCCGFCLKLYTEGFVFIQREIMSGGNVLLRILLQMVQNIELCFSICLMLCLNVCTFRKSCIKLLNYELLYQNFT